MTWGMIGAAAVTTGGGFLASSMADDPEQGSFQTAPEYPEATQARGTLSETLQGYSPENQYGAVQQPWSDIWQQALDRVKTYYHGSATAPTGAVGRLKGGLASRNMADQPAAARSLTRLTAEEGGQVGDLASQQAISEAQFGENARMNWLQGLQGVAGMSPQSVYQQPQDTYGASNMVSDISGAAGSLFSNMSQMNTQSQMLKDIYGGTNLPPTAAPTGTNTPAGVGRYKPRY